MIGSSGYLSAFEGKLREAPDHHPVTAVLQRQDHLRQALELLAKLSAGGARTPMRRFAEPEEMAGGILYLASRASSMVTGHILAIDGGWVAI